MKVLIVSFRYLPFNSIGTNRIVSLVNFLKSKNVPYKVITAYSGYHKIKDYVPDENVIYIKWYDFKRLRSVDFNEYRKEPAAISRKKEVKYSFPQSVFNSVKKVINLLLYPDPYLSWVFYSKKRLNNILKDFNPTVIYSSSYPYSSHILANFISKKTDAKWYAELRDPWVDNHVNRNPVINFFNKYLSKKIFKNAEKLVTVSKIWQEHLQNFYNKKTILVRNGFVKTTPVISNIDEFIVNKIKQSNRKKIIYTGNIFPQFQNIESFIQTFVNDPELLNKYDFVYVGANKKIIEDLLHKNNYRGNNVILFDKVSSETALLVQQQADFLLLFNWKDDKLLSKGVLPGKFYEYLGANKAIILWNESVENELFNLCKTINKQHQNDKVLIINSNDKLSSKLNSFIFDKNTHKINMFSREYQFNNLLKEIHEG